MNILLLTQFFSTTRGGGEYVFSLLAKKLAENNHQVWVITNKIKDEKYNVQKNINLIFVPPTIEHKGGLPPKFSDNVGYSLCTVVKGLKIIKKEKIDVIHSNNFAPALSGSILSSITKKPHITTVHDVFSLGNGDFWEKWRKQSGVSKINASLAPFFEKLMMDFKFKCIHAVSEATKNDLLEFGAKKPIYVVPNAIEFSENRNEKFNPTQFVFVGRLVFYKNLELLIKAINLLKDDYPKIKLVIVGDGPYKKSLEDLIHKLNLENKIEFLGYVNNETKEKIIQESNALLFPSMFEGFGLVILEAFAQNKPAIVSNIRPMSDIVSHNSTGYVLDPQNEKIWAEHILKLAKNPNESERMGKNGNEVLKTKYHPDLMYKKIIAIYENACNN